MQWVNELGNMFSQSPKAKAKFHHIQEQTAGGPLTNISKIRPLCPTRWLYRKSQIEEVINKYEIMLQTLEELVEDKYEKLVACFKISKMVLLISAALWLSN